MTNNTITKVFTSQAGPDAYKTDAADINVCADFYKKGIVEIYNLFNAKKIQINVSDIVKSIVFITSEDAYILDGVTIKHSDAAVFDEASNSIYLNIDTISKLSDNVKYQMLKKTFSHEIGHAIHVNYISPASKKYFDDFTNEYLKFLYALKRIKEKVEKKFFFKEKYAKKSHKNVLDSFENFLNRQEEDIKKEILKNYENQKVADQAISSFFKKDISGKKDIVEETVKDIIRIIKSLKALYVSERALTNKEEDFAELFSSWLLDESSLSDIQVKRLILCFSLSKKDGKVIIENKNLTLKNYIAIILENYFI